MRIIIENIMYGRRDGLYYRIIAFPLWLLSMLFAVVVWLRNTLYGHGLLQIQHVPCRVISIGNITVGGTGKTPITIYTANLLGAKGFKVAVVSRGYRRPGSEPLIVSDGSRVTADAAEAGDEPHIIASSLEGVPVVVGVKRYEAAKLAYETFTPDVILLDDAFQHRKLGRTLDVVVLDARYPFGNGALAPRGLLREPVSSLRRAHCVVISHLESADVSAAQIRDITALLEDGRVFKCRHMAKQFRSMADGAVVPLSSLTGLKAAAVSNIASPQSFHDMLDSLGVKTVHRVVRPDHHRYSVEELQNIEDACLHAGAEAAIMTAKDERNMPKNFTFNTIKGYILDITIEFIEGGDVFFDFIASNSISEE